MQSPHPRCTLMTQQPASSQRRQLQAALRLAVSQQAPLQQLSKMMKRVRIKCNCTCLAAHESRQSGSTSCAD